MAELGPPRREGLAADGAGGDGGERDAHLPGAVPTAAPAVAQYAGNVMKPFADFATGA